MTFAVQLRDIGTVRFEASSLKSLKERLAKDKGLMVTGGSDCHQQPVIMGTMPVPVYVVEQFGIDYHDLETNRKER